MRRITNASREPLHNTATTRQLERRVQSGLEPHTLMDRAGLAVARLAAAIAPHARSIWVACGPGNNGGDGLIAAAHLTRWRNEGRGSWQVHLTHSMGSTPDPARLPGDARHALSQAIAAGVRVAADPPDQADLVVDALLGIGALEAPAGVLGQWQARMDGGESPILAVDLPSGLSADTGTWSGPILRADGPVRHTLSLLTLKPGLFTADGRDAAGDVWFDDLGVAVDPDESPCAWLSPAKDWQAQRPHRSHKGSHGDVVVIGGQYLGITGAGMTGAGVLAARAALESGAGRVYLALLGGALTWDPACAELMMRTPEHVLQSPVLGSAAVVCGCGGGEAVTPLLPVVISRSLRLVLDADALNAVASDPALVERVRSRRKHGQTTVITPHPLEAARLLDCDTTDVMRDRLGAAQSLSERLGAICVLKGSGTVIAAPDQKPHINASGNARLATAGTGDVLAGMIGAGLARSREPDCLAQVLIAVAHHGRLADQWAGCTLTAGRLAQAINR